MTGLQISSTSLSLSVNSSTSASWLAWSDGLRSLVRDNGEAFNTPRVLLPGFSTHRTILLYRHLARPRGVTRFRDLRGTRVVAKQEILIIRFCALQMRCTCHR